ncbi:MAG: chorismate synthase, partial [Prevotellaceae bacterium]|nr:chorismate synthase [Prevotellaceae bacterium]
PEIISGCYNEHTTGAPLTILFANKDVNSVDYERFRDVPRPGHADFAASKKWHGYNDIRGGGYLSGRLTVALVAAGVIAKKLIAPVNVYANLVKAGGSYDIQEAIEEAIKEGDSIGGVIECCVQGLPCGWGEPFFDSVEALLSHILFSIPGVKGIDFGAGFDVADMKGSEFNDVIINATGQTKENNAGGITGGITNGNDLFMTVALRPSSSIKKAQQTFDLVTEKETTLQIDGRHDTCFALRASVIVEAAVAIVLADLMRIANC